MNTSYIKSCTRHLSRPGSRVLRPGSRVVRLGSYVVRPGSRVVRLGSRVVRPGSRVVRPGSRVVRLGSRAVRPGSRVVRPGSRAVRPGSRVVRLGNYVEGFGRPLINLISMITAFTRGCTAIGADKSNVEMCMTCSLPSFILLLLSVGVFSTVKGQQADSHPTILIPIEREVLIVENPWLSVENPAGWQHHFQSLGNELQLSMNGSDGDFHRPQSPEKETTYGLLTSGYKLLNGNLLYGKFASKSIHEKNVQWNLMSDPYNGSRMLIADSISGDWNGDVYSLSAGIASKPIFKFVTAGIKLDYQVSNSARDNDPRPESIERDITATPGLCFHINSHHYIGTHFSYQSKKEKLKVNNMSGVRSNTIYSMIGLREWEHSRDRTSVSMLNRSDSYTSGLQYEMNRNDWTWLTGFKYTFRKDENEFDPYGSVVVADELQFKTRPMGEYARNQYKATTSLVRSANSGLHHAEVQFKSWNGKLWDAINEHATYNEKQREATLKYQFYRQVPGQIPWKSGFSFQYSSCRYNELYYATEKVKNINLSLSGNKYFYLAKKNILEFGIQLQSKMNLKELLIIDPQSDFIKKETAISEHIIRPNHAFFSENYNKFKLFSSWAFSLNDEMGGFVRCIYYFTRSKYMGDGQSSMISAGILF